MFIILLSRIVTSTTTKNRKPSDTTLYSAAAAIVSHQFTQRQRGSCSELRVIVLYYDVVSVRVRGGGRGNNTEFAGLVVIGGREVDEEIAGIY